ncbi:MAG: SMC family ATPase [Deferribacteres bacterium]|nr:SMC family ATPase [candidate division KSB1 bacterium]MCB9512541.1 SMC family ATPase [Deferribacteres bacterium]
MIIKQITLKNYRRFRKLSIEFPENLQGFLGSNGAGKSTIIEAIAWALYGTRAARGAKVDIRSFLAPPKEECQVCLIFEVGSIEYRIDRQLRGKNAIAEASIYQHGSQEPLAVQEGGVNACVEEIIGLDYRSFFASVFARQKDLAALSEMRPEERKLAINRLINIEAIDKARKMAMEKRKAADDELRGMQAMLKDTDTLEKQVAESAEAHKHELEATRLAQEAMQKAQTTLENSKSNFAELNGKRDRFQSLRSEIAQMRSEVNGTDKQIAAIRQDLKRIESSESQLVTLEKDKTRYFDVKSKKQELENERLKASSRHKMLEDITYNKQQAHDEQIIVARLLNQIAKSPDPDTAFDSLDAQRETLLQEAKKLKENENKLAGELGALKSKGTELRERENQIAQMGPDSPCPVCMRPLGNHHDAVLSALKEELTQLLAQYRAVEKQKQSISDQLLFNQDKQSELQQKREARAQEVTLVRQQRKEVQGYEVRRDRYLKKAEEIQAEIEAMGDVHYDEKTYIQLNAEFEKLTTIYEHIIKLEAQVERKSDLISQQQKLTEQKQELQLKLQKSDSELEKLHFDENAFQTAKKRYEDDADSLQQVRQTLVDAEKAEALAKARLKGQQDELERAKMQLKKVALLQEEKQYYDALAFHFGRFRLELAGRLRPMIAARASELLRMTTNGRYNLLELDDDYIITIVDQGQAFPLTRFSGGEQDLANLCLRVAISQVVAERSGKTPVQFIVLDEVFGSQDAHRQNLIMQALQSLQSQFRQIFLISHVDSIKEILPVIIQVEMISPHESKASLI